MANTQVNLVALNAPCALETRLLMMIGLRVVVILGIRVILGLQVPGRGRVQHVPQASTKQVQEIALASNVELESTHHKFCRAVRTVLFTQILPR